VLGPGVSHGLLHGRLSAEEKADALAAFAAGRTNVLIATTVVEVGATLFPSPRRPFHVSSHLKRQRCFSNGVILQGMQVERFWHNGQLCDRPGWHIPLLHQSNNLLIPICILVGWPTIKASVKEYCVASVKESRIIVITGAILCGRWGWMCRRRV
jgi:hypothetical protein